MAWVIGPFGDQVEARCPVIFFNFDGEGYCCVESVSHPRPERPGVGRSLLLSTSAGSHWAQGGAEYWKVEVPS